LVESRERLARPSTASISADSRTPKVLVICDRDIPEVVNDELEEGGVPGFGFYYKVIGVSIHEWQPAFRHPSQRRSADLTVATEAEVVEWTEANRHLENFRGDCQVVRNDYLPKPSITKGIGPVELRRTPVPWQAQYHQWSKRSLKDNRYAYLWMDGIHFNICLQQDRHCILVVMGAMADSKKQLIAIADGDRKSGQSWTDLLLDVKPRGLSIDPDHR
jgi:hypothetical protein